MVKTLIEKITSVPKLKGPITQFG